MFGVVANLFTGMLMAKTPRYVNEATFWPTIFFLPIGAIAVMDFLSDRLWEGQGRRGLGEMRP